MELKFKARVNNKVVFSNGFMKHFDGTIIVITKQKEDYLETSPIDKDTLCVSTGRIDIKGVEIFEKDIVEHYIKSKNLDESDWKTITDEVKFINGLWCVGAEQYPLYGFKNKVIGDSL